MAHEKAYIEEVTDEADIVNHDEESPSESSEDEEQRLNGSHQAESSAAGASSGASSKKKKKKKSRAARALAALRPKDKLNEAIVDQVMQKVGGREDQPEVDREDVRKAIEEMKLVDVLKGKAGLGGKNRKDMGEHKVRLPGHCFIACVDHSIVLGYTTCPTTRYISLFLFNESDIYCV